MPNGSVIREGVNLTAGQNNTIYTVPSGLQAVFSTILVVNNDTAQKNVRIAISDTTTPTAGEWITPQNLPIASEDSLLLTAGFTAASGQNIVAFCEAGADIVVGAFGRLETEPS